MLSWVQGDFYMRIRLNDYEVKDVIRILRETTELTRNEFGKSINLAGGTIKNYELGKSNFSVKLLKEIAEKHNFIITIEKK